MPVTITRPILRIGRWDASTGPFDCTQAGLDHIIARFAEPDQDTPAIKLGHWSEFGDTWDDGVPALGWILGIRQEGDTMWASIALIESSLERLGVVATEMDLTYPRGSVELHRKDVDNPDSLVLGAFSLLGATEPAVKGIEYTAALDELAPAESDGWTIRPAGMSIAAKSRQGRFVVEVAATETKPVKSGVRATQPPTKGCSVMPEMSEAVLAALGLDDTADDAAVLAAIEATKTPPATKVDASTDEPTTTAVDAAALAELQASNADLEARLACFEAERNVAASHAIVNEALAAGKITASSRDAYLKRAEKDLAGTRELLSELPAIVPVGATGSAAKTGVIASDQRASALSMLTGQPAANFNMGTN